jgi:hypothetical protein
MKMFTGTVDAAFLGFFGLPFGGGSRRVLRPTNYT